MRIIDIEIQNNRTVKAFIKRLDGENLEIAGEPGTGKTTGVSALWEIMEKRADALSHGEKKGQIKIKLSDGNKTLVATRTITPKSSSITIVDNEADKISIADFKAMISGLAVNPHKIMDMKPKDQTATLLTAANIGDGILESFDQTIKDLEQERLLLHRQAEQAKPAGEEPARVEPVNVAELFQKKEEIQKANAENARQRDFLQELIEEEQSYDEHESSAIAAIERIKKDLEEAKEKLKTIKQERKELKERIKKGKSHVATLKDAEITHIINQIAEAEDRNNQASIYNVWMQQKEQYESLKAQHSQTDSKIKDTHKEKKSVLDSAQFPLSGLSIQDGQIIYNDCLLSNLGTSEQMLVCASLALKDILAHDIHVVRMDGIESMGKEDFEALKKLFNGHDVQVLATRVSRGDVEPEEITIIDGVYKDD